MNLLSEWCQQEPVRFRFVFDYFTKHRANKERAGRVAWPTGTLNSNLFGTQFAAASSDAFIYATLPYHIIPTVS